MQKNRNGVLVVQSDAEIVFAAGLGSDPVVQSMLQGRWRQRVGKPVPRLFALDQLSDPLTVLTYTSAGAACFLMYRHPEGDPLFEFVSAVDFSADILRHFVTNPYEAITVVDDHARIRYMSPVHQKFFGVPLAGVIGAPVNEVIENTRLAAVLQTGKSEIGHVQRMRGTSRVVSRTPIFSPEGQTVGAIGQVMFKSPAALEAMNQEISRLRQELSFYERELPRLQGRVHGLDALVGTSDVVRKLKEQIIKVAPLDVPVLLVGESGVGKDLVAHAIHQLGNRSRKSMVLINAAAMPTNLVEAELFGYEGGSFTGAEKKGRAGKFEQADQSSLFLDEIGDMPLEVQVKLLRTLQDGSFQRVGGSTARRSDFRLISASNRDFRQMLARGDFRLDLFYRISAVTIRIPPLRERLEDVPLLAETFLSQFVRRHQVEGKFFGQGVMNYLQSLPWPGNVRQLQHTIERAAIFSEGDEITLADCEVPLDIGAASELHLLDQGAFDGSDPFAASAIRAPLPSGEPDTVRSAKSRVELELIQDALRKFGGNKKKAAEYLGISRSHLYKKLANVAEEESFS